jgi:RNA polymerase-binding transcription factor
MPLKKSEIENFKKRLLDLRAKLTGSLRESSQEVKQSQDKGSRYSQHQADQGTDDFDRTVTLELTSQELGQLKQIDRALEKIEDNTYGTCDITGEEIPLKRLEAIPYATMTVKAQEMVEKGLI